MLQATRDTVVRQIMNLHSRGEIENTQADKTMVLGFDKHFKESKIK